MPATPLGLRSRRRAGRRKGYTCAHTCDTAVEREKNCTNDSDYDCDGGGGYDDDENGGGDDDNDGDDGDTDDGDDDDDDVIALTLS